MPGNRRYGNRRYRPRKRVSKTDARSNTGRKAQSRQITKLQKQITRIDRQVQDTIQYRQYAMSDHVVLEGTGEERDDTHYSIINLVNPAQWLPIFQTPSMLETVSPNKFRGRSLGLEVVYELSNPDVASSPITATTFVCSLRKEVAAQFRDRTNNGSGMTNQIDFYKSEMSSEVLPTEGQGDGMVFLNKGIFKIRYVKRWTIGGKTNFEPFVADVDDVAATTSLADNRKRLYIKLPYRNFIKSDGPDSRSTVNTGGFRTLTMDTIEPTDQLYLFTFANNYGDQKLSISFSAIFTGVTSN